MSEYQPTCDQHFIVLVVTILRVVRSRPELRELQMNSLIALRLLDLHMTEGLRGAHSTVITFRVGKPHVCYSDCGRFGQFVNA